MADVKAKPRKRDRLKARARRYADLPLRLRTADLPRRAASAAVMLAVTALALWQGGAVLAGFIVVVALVCLGEFVALVRRATKKWANRIAAVLAGSAYIGAAAVSLLRLELYYLIAVLGVVIFTDTCAYFAGRTIGGPKIAPRISPSKTWAGLAGGMAGSALWLEAYMSLAHNTGAGVRWADSYALSIAEVIGWALVGAVLAVAAQAGDFFESWLKRRANKKDSSNLIPGHGGVFDRVDGLLPVAIVTGLLAAFA
ncbi:phosphatidate cytidylyltransferase [Qipengyuania sediminis]|uniref:phosphatidate cytidylyltransferase n=1 Tax=Qipengyuania sediminis TaxID=1532023 RepID=UPI0010598168|nr:phosphatidate cytidylyltransferase [Qipengyuania sediminis]